VFSAQVRIRVWLGKRNIEIRRLLNFIYCKKTDVERIDFQIVVPENHRLVNDWLKTLQK